MIKQLLNKYMYKRNPVAYCRKLGVTIGQGCSIMGTSHPFGTEPYLITLGDHVRINEGVQFVTHDGSVWVLRGINLKDQKKIFGLTFKDIDDIDLFNTISVGNNVQIGSKCIILPGVRIGNNCIIGAGSVVTKDIPNDTVVAGVPARPIESIKDYFFKHKEEFSYTKHMTPEEKREYLEQEFLRK